MSTSMFASFHHISLPNDIELSQARWLIMKSHPGYPRSYTNAYASPSHCVTHRGKATIVAVLHSRFHKPMPLQKATLSTPTSSAEPIRSHNNAKTLLILRLLIVLVSPLYLLLNRFPSPQFSHAGVAMTAGYVLISRSCLHSSWGWLRHDGRSVVMLLWRCGDMLVEGVMVLEMEMGCFDIVTVDGRAWRW